MHSFFSAFGAFFGTVIYNRLLHRDFIYFQINIMLGTKKVIRGYFAGRAAMRKLFWHIHSFNVQKTIDGKCFSCDTLPVIATFHVPNHKSVLSFFHRVADLSSQCLIRF